jgi:hypothetical protein
VNASFVGANNIKRGDVWFNIVVNDDRVVFLFLSAIRIARSSDCSSGRVCTIVSKVSCGTGTVVGARVGLDVGRLVWMLVGARVGTFVGLPVGANAGRLVGLPVGARTGRLVGLPVGARDDIGAVVTGRDTGADVIFLVGAFVLTLIGAVVFNTGLAMVGGLVFVTGAVVNIIGAAVGAGIGKDVIGDY